VLATCALPDGSDINAWMVRQGWALAYYSEAYRTEEDEAHAARRGVWAGSFIPPWEWRRQHRHWWMG
jgi:endonuclease YncB( thermonuclease family)